MNTSTDSNNNTTTYTYGTSSCGNSFPTTISMPLSLSRSQTWNCNGGLTASQTDENGLTIDRKSTRLNSSHGYISYAVFCLKKKKLGLPPTVGCVHSKTTV